MKLSIIIVNYNVRHFLEQAVSSSLKALDGIDGEIIVVDNASVDDSAAMIQQNFPSVKLIISSINLGFSKANNLGLKHATGEYILFLNPDTIVEEMCFEKCLDLLDKHPEIGAIGVPMMDGTGNFLPESKRGFPDVWNSFCKMSGLGSLFPKSKWFNGYYLGHLSQHQDHYIDVLSGAFFLTRCKILDSLGGFDESYFMYGEDIDLSYRIQQAGYKNFYFTGTRIIHFKGESTSKGSLNYVKHFYQAMITFSKKNLSGFSAWGLGLLLTGIIWLHGGFYFIKNLITKYRMLALDAIVLLGGFYLIKKFWAQWYFDNPYYFSSFTIKLNLILYVLTWIFSFWILGLYDFGRKFHHYILAVITGFLINLMFYAMLPESWRSSRMILLLSFLFTLIYVILSRLTINTIKSKKWAIASEKVKNIMWVGSIDELSQVHVLLQRSKIQYHIVHTVADDHWKNQASFWAEIIRVYQVEEIIFSEKSLSADLILAVMSQLKGEVSFKILNQSGLGIIGSSSKDNKGELYTMDFQYNLTQHIYRRQKRFFDLLFCGILIILSPVTIWLFNNRRQWFNNIWNVLIGKNTWVGYTDQEAIQHALPKISSGVLSLQRNILTESYYQNYLHMYAWNYSFLSDLEICLRDFLFLDTRPNYGT